MIEILGGRGEDLDAAHILKSQILDLWPDLEDHQEDKVLMHIGTRVPAGKRQDIDLTILAFFSKPRSFTPTWIKDIQEGNELVKKVKVLSFCVAIEIKSHDPRGIRVKDGKVEARRKAYWENVSDQNFEQRFALLNTFRKLFKKRIFVTNHIFLKGCNKEAFQDEDFAIQKLAHLRDSSFIDFLQCIMMQKGEIYNEEYNRDGIAFFQCGNKEAFEEAFNCDLYKTIVPTSLDRKKMELIEELRATDAHRKIWLADIGKKQIILRGRGGTGKTVLMLHMAYKKAIEEGSRCLFLTYNRALIADLKRLKEILNISSGDSGIAIDSLERFMMSILSHHTDTPINKLLFTYSNDLSSLQEDMKENEGMGKKMLKELCRQKSNQFDFDYIFVDEGQDWIDQEMFVLRSMYDTKNIIVSHGVGQSIRDRLEDKREEADWNKDLSKDQSVLRVLKRALRMKENIAKTIIDFNDKLGGYELETEPVSDSPGGRVLVVEGDYFSRKSTNEEIIKEAKDLGNENIDLLFCCSKYRVVREGRSGQYSIPSRKLKDLGFTTWDGVNKEVRQAFPVSNDALRIVLFDSCRGLEGWSVINLGFDELWDIKYNKSLSAAQKYSTDPEGEARILARDWMMIPLTRAIDTLVLEISSRNTFIGKHLYEMHLASPDTIEWKESNPEV